MACGGVVKEGKTMNAIIKLLAIIILLPIAIYMLFLVFIVVGLATM